MKEDLMELVLKAHEKSIQRAFETAVRTETALIYYRDGKIVEVKPPFRYELVPLKQTKNLKYQQKKLKGE